MQRSHSECKISGKAKTLVVLLVLIAFFRPAVVTANDLLAVYREGRQLMQAGQYAKALERFDAIKHSYTTLQDYLIYDTAFCLEMIRNIPAAREKYREIITSHQKSPLYQSAFRRLLELGKLSWSEGVMEDYHQYLREFPTDNRTLIELAQQYRRLGREAEANSLYRRVFLSGGPHVLVGYQALQNAGEPPSTAEIKQAAARLLDKDNHDDVITLLEPLFQIDDEFRLLLAKGYFGKRRYRDVINLLERSKLRESRPLFASALARANERIRFYQVMEELIREGRRDLFAQHYSMAEMKRREGSTDEARNIFRSMLSLYPDKKDDILWGLAWLEIRKRNFGEAERILLSLTIDRSVPADKHLFWLSKVMSYQGKDGSNFLSQLKDTNGYYWLAINRRPPADQTSWDGKRSNAPLSEPLGAVYMRISHLSALGMKSEAAIEAQGVLNLVSHSQADTFAALLFAIEDYQGLVRLGIRNNILKYRYPLAYFPLVKHHAEKHKIDPLLVIAIMREESHFRPDAVSRAGALGVMQLMPATARRFAKIERREELFQVEKNIAIACEYLARLVAQFSLLPQALAAYNAGEGNVLRWINTPYLDLDEFIEDIPFAETRNYVLKVMRSYQIKKHLFGTMPLEAPAGGEMF